MSSHCLNDHFLPRHVWSYICIICIAYTPGYIRLSFAPGDHTAVTLAQHPHDLPLPLGLTSDWLCAMANQLRDVGLSSMWAMASRRPRVRKMRSDPTATAAWIRWGICQQSAAPRQEEQEGSARMARPAAAGLSSLSCLP
jgi:hypothetical protein